MRFNNFALTTFLFSSLGLSMPAGHVGRNAAPNVGEINVCEIFANYVNQFFYERDYEGALKKYLSPNLIQHNPTIANGALAEINAVQATTKGYAPNLQIWLVDKNGIGPATNYSADDTAGCGMTYVRWSGEPGTSLPLTGVADVYRINTQGLFVEHWDVIEALPNNIINSNPF